MGSDFQVVMLRRNELLHRLAIWQEVSDHLSKFLDTDAIPATMGIRTEGGGMVVPQDRIEAVLDEVKNVCMSAITEELGRIDKSKVEDDVKKQASKKTSKGKKEKGAKVKRTGPRSKKD